MTDDDKTLILQISIRFLYSRNQLIGVIVVSRRGFWSKVGGGVDGGAENENPNLIVHWVWKIFWSEGFFNRDGCID